MDSGTSFGEREIPTERSARVMIELFEKVWKCRHGNPERFSANPQFCKPFFRNVLHRIGIALDEQQACASHKNGKVTRNNGIFNAVLQLISREETTAPAAILVAWASFLTNIFH